MSYIPKGCDQQGRYPQAAEAATDLGVEEPEHDLADIITQDLLAVTAICAVAVIVLLALGVL